MRPVFPIVTSPVIDPTSGEATRHVTGFGDMQVLSVVGPDRTDGTVWGVGTTFELPTATDPLIGAGK